MRSNASYSESQGHYQYPSIRTIFSARLGRNGIDIVQALPFDRTSTDLKVGGDRQTAGQRTAKAMPENRSEDLRGTSSVLTVQQGREHEGNVYGKARVMLPRRSALATTGT